MSFNIIWWHWTIYVCLYRIYMTLSALLNVHPNQYCTCIFISLSLIHVYIICTYVWCILVYVYNCRFEYLCKILECNLITTSSDLTENKWTRVKYYTNFKFEEAWVVTIKARIPTAVAQTNSSNHLNQGFKYNQIIDTRKCHKLDVVFLTFKLHVDYFYHHCIQHTTCKIGLRLLRYRYSMHRYIDNTEEKTKQNYEWKKQNIHLFSKKRSGIWYLKSDNMYPRHGLRPLIRI